MEIKVDSLSSGVVKSQPESYSAEDSIDIQQAKITNPLESSFFSLFM